MQSPGIRRRGRTANMGTMQYTAFVFDLRKWHWKCQSRRLWFTTSQQIDLPSTLRSAARDFGSQCDWGMYLWPSRNWSTSNDAREGSVILIFSSFTIPQIDKHIRGLILRLFGIFEFRQQIVVWPTWHFARLGLHRVWWWRSFANLRSCHDDVQVCTDYSSLTMCQTRRPKPQIQFVPLK